MNVQDEEVSMPSKDLKRVDCGPQKDLRQLSSHPMTQVATKRAKYLVLWPFLVVVGHTLQHFSMNG